MTNAGNEIGLVNILDRCVSEFGNAQFYGVKGPQGYKWITFRMFADMVSQLRGGLKSLGLEKDQTVAIISNNCVEWAVSCYASYSSGAYFTSLYENQRPEEWQYILNDARAVIVFVARKEMALALDAFKKDLPFLRHIICLDGSSSDPHSYLGLLKIGQTNPVAAIYPKSTDIMGFIYTSGTTGNPKGVVLTHGNIIFNLKTVPQIVELTPEDRSLSFLPWSHILGQLAEVHLPLYIGFSVGLAVDISTLSQNLGEVKPTLFFSVPKVFNRIYDGVMSKMHGSPKPIQLLFEKGLAYAQKKKNNQHLSLAEKAILGLADKIIFSKIRLKFGGRLRLAVSGAAALSPEIAHFIDNLGIIVLEGYGLSETSPLVSINTPDIRKIGSVGPVIPGVKVVISEVGEIIVYGPNVMKGYFNMPKETQEVMTADGGFKTGDLGRIDEEGFLFITGRIKEQFKLENGKYVAPAPLEEELKLSPAIEHVFLYGSNLPYNSLLIVPNREFVQKWAKQQGINLEETPSTWNKNEQVKKFFQDEIAGHVHTFKSYEIPRKFTFVDDIWGVDNGILTPTLKLKRKVVQEKYKDIIKSS